MGWAATRGEAPVTKKRYAEQLGAWIDIGNEKRTGGRSDVEVSDALGMGLYEGFARRHLLTH